MQKKKRKSRTKKERKEEKKEQEKKESKKNNLEVLGPFSLCAELYCCFLELGLG